MTLKIKKTPCRDGANDKTLKRLNHISIVPKLLGHKKHYVTSFVHQQGVTQ
jgi:hypothetical protein